MSAPSTTDTSRARGFVPSVPVTTVGFPAPASSEKIAPFAPVGSGSPSAPGSATYSVLPSPELAMPNGATSGGPSWILFAAPPLGGALNTAASPLSSSAVKYTSSAIGSGVASNGRENSGPFATSDSATPLHGRAPPPPAPPAPP